MLRRRYKHCYQILEDGTLQVRRVDAMSRAALLGTRGPLGRRPEQCGDDSMAGSRVCRKRLTTISLGCLPVVVCPGVWQAPNFHGEEELDVRQLGCGIRLCDRRGDINCG